MRICIFVTVRYSDNFVREDADYICGGSSMSRVDVVECMSVCCEEEDKKTNEGMLW